MFESYWNSILVLMGINILWAWSLYIPLSAGVLSCGQPGFASIGAYSSALATLAGWPFPASLTLGGILALIFGIALGISSLRLRGFGVAISTLAFAEMVRIFFTNVKFFGGAQGIYNIPLFTNLSLVWGIVAIFFFFFLRLSRSRLGRALDAVREDELAAETMGINSARIKIFTMGVSGLLAGLGGGLYAHFLCYLEPPAFGFGLLIQMCVNTIFGGSLTYLGPFFGTVFLSSLSEYLRFFVEWRLLIYGLLIVLLLILRPQGIITRELVAFSHRMILSFPSKKK